MASVALAGLLNLVTVLNTRMNSALGQNICANLKDVFLIAFAYVFQSVNVDVGVLTGVSLTVIGGLIFSFERHLIEALSRVRNGDTVLTLPRWLLSTPGWRFLSKHGFFLNLGLFASLTISLVLWPWFKTVSGIPSMQVVDTRISKDIATVLITVTGGWAEASYRDRSHKLYLDAILQSYVEICEAGYRPTIILLAYDTVPVDWVNVIIDSSNRMCRRIQQDLSVRMEMFPKHALPEGSFGTGGDLALDHHTIFEREKENYDWFVCQEDDVRLSPDNLRVVVQSYNQLQRFGRSEYHPYLYRWESIGGNRFVTWSARRGVIFKMDGVTYFHPEWSSGGCCMYMVSQQTLLSLVGANTSDWSSPRLSGKTEFNPVVASWEMLARHNFKLVVPLHEFKGSSFHHMPDKYVAEDEYLPTQGYHPQFAPPTFAEMSFVYSTCLQRESTESISANITLLGDNCFECLHRKQFAKLEAVLWRRNASRWMNATFLCTDSEYQ